MANFKAPGERKKVAKNQKYQNSISSKTTCTRMSPKQNLWFKNYLTIYTVINVLIVVIAMIQFYEPSTSIAEAGKSKKYVVVKEMKTVYKKVPVTKKVPVKVLKIKFKKKKSKPWKKWFKKEMIVKIPQHKKHHHHHHYAASSLHQTWLNPKAQPQQQQQTITTNNEQNIDMAANFKSLQMSAPIYESTPRLFGDMYRHLSLPSQSSQITSDSSQVSVDNLTMQPFESTRISSGLSSTSADAEKNSIEQATNESIDKFDSAKLKPNEKTISDKSSLVAHIDDLAAYE